MNKLLLVGFVVTAIVACEKGNYEFNSDFEYNDTIDLQYWKCINSSNNQFSICFDSVLTDSRCPEDLICIWAGEAIARFRITIQNSEPVFLDLHAGTIDKEINGYRISFLDLLPYPNSKMQRDVKNYKARIRLKQVR